MKRDFLQLADFSLQEHRALLARAKELKARRRQRLLDETLKGRTLALVFEKPSTRTRVSFEAAMVQLGGSAIVIGGADSQISRGETIEDTARVISRYVDCIMFRTFGDDRLQAFARASSVPVINGLSNGAHPVQLLADLMTVEERLGSVEGKKVAFVGDAASNMALSWIEAGRLFGFEVVLGAPAPYRPAPDQLQGVKVFDRASEAAAGADVIATDVWTSMGQEAEAKERLRRLDGFIVDEALVARAKPHCVVLHCLPAHRGEEISAGVIDATGSAVWDEAENRMHAQKALLEMLMTWA
ncbi:MAG TPA: ornithine carbamoyltransferase [Myxococcaceae bacterium]|nr:ornithine carbamoyltransferase [Myxococcaceae bacterium]